MSVSLSKAKDLGCGRSFVAALLRMTGQAAQDDRADRLTGQSKDPTDTRTGLDGAGPAPCYNAHARGFTRRA